MNQRRCRNMHKKRIKSWIFIILILLSLIPIFNPVQTVSGAWWNNDWSYYIPITIESDYIDNNLKNFPILVIINSTVGSFCDGGDSIRFVNTDNITEYYYEIERWDDAGDSFVWVNISTVDSGSDTVFLMYYNNSEASDGQDPTNVWDANYIGVYHFGDFDDSTSNNKDLTSYGTPDTLSGKIGRCQYFNPPQNEYANHTNFYDFDTTKNVSIEVWANHYGFGPSDSTYAGIHLQDSASSNHGIRLATRTAATRTWAATVKNTINSIVEYSQNYNTNTYHYVSGNYNETEVNMFFNGSAQGTETGITDWTLFPTNRLEVARLHKENPDHHYKGEFDELRISNIRRNVSYFKASFHSGNQTTGFITYGATVAFPSSGVPLEPTDFTVTTLGEDSIKLDWVVGTNATHTIVRRGTSGYPVTVFSGTLVCNSTGVTFTDIDLPKSQRYYYRTWSYNETWGNYSFLYNESWNHTGPADPTNIIGTPEDANFNISWTMGTDASHTLVIRDVDIYPRNITDGTELYNGTGTYHVDNNVETNYRYTLFSYDDITNLYSPGAETPWGALDVNCYDEETLDPLIFNILVTTESGDEAYYATNCSNTKRISVEVLPTGENIGIHITAFGDYNNQSQIFTGYPAYQNQSTTYIQLNYTAMDKETTNVTCYNSTGGTETYPSFVLSGDIIYIYPNAADEFDQVNITYQFTAYGHRWYYMDLEENQFYTLDTYLPPSTKKQLYLLTILDEYGETIKDAKITIRRLLNGSYVNVSSILSNGYGQASVYLIYEEPYKFVINKTGYQEEYSDWTPKIDEDSHIFQMLLLEEETIPVEITDVIVLEGTLHTNNTIYIRYYDRYDETIDTSFRVYEIYNKTATYKAIYNGTTERSLNIWLSVTNVSRQHIVIMDLNHTTLGYVENHTVAISRIRIPSDKVPGSWLESRWTGTMGSFEYGYINVFMIYFPAVALLLIIGYAGEAALGTLIASLYCGWITWYIFLSNEEKILTLMALGILIAFIVYVTKKGRSVTT